MSSDELVKRLREYIPAEGHAGIAIRDKLMREAADALSAQAKSPPVAVAAELPEMPPQFYAVKWHCGGEMFYAGNMLVVEKDRYIAHRTAAEQIIAAKDAEIARLANENQEYNGDVAEATAHYNFQLKRAESAESRLAVAEAALKAQWHYSDHTSHCQVGNSFENEPLCDCGYDEAKILYDEAMKGVKK